MKNFAWLLLIPLLVGCQYLQVNKCAEGQIWNEGSQSCEVDKTLVVETMPEMGTMPEMTVFEWEMIEEKTEAYELRYPKFTAGVPALVEILNTDMASGTASFIQQAQDWKAEVDADPEVDFSAPWMLSIDPAYEFEDEAFVSLRLDTYDYSGGAHGNAYYGMMNYHVPTESSVGLADLFVDDAYLTFLAEAIEPQIVAQKEERYADYEGQEYVPEEDTFMKDGLVPEVNNFKIFQFENGTQGKGLTFLFAPYQLGPYVQGSFVAFVPAADLAQYAKPEYKNWFQ